MPTEVATARAPCSRVDRASRSDPPAIAVAEADPGPSKASRDSLERLVESGHQGRPPRTFTRSEVRSVGGYQRTRKKLETLPVETLNILKALCSRREERGPPGWLWALAHRCRHAPYFQGLQMYNLIQPQNLRTAIFRDAGDPDRPPRGSGGEGTQITKSESKQRLHDQGRAVPQALQAQGKPLPPLTRTPRAKPVPSPRDYGPGSAEDTG